MKAVDHAGIVAAAVASLQTAAARLEQARLAVPFNYYAFEEATRLLGEAAMRFGLALRRKTP